MKSNHCFIEFDNENEALESIEEMNGKNIEGSRIVV